MTGQTQEAQPSGDSLLAFEAKKLESSTSGTSAPGTPKGEAEGPEASRIVAFNGERLEVPEDLWDAEKGTIRAEAALKRMLDLRRKLSEGPPAPETYALEVPEALREKVAADLGHPLAQPAMDWARKHKLSQEAFNELTGLFYAQEAATSEEDAHYRAGQDEALTEALGAQSEKVKKELGQWVGGLLSKDFKENPALLEAANLLASDAKGVLLLKAFKDRIGEHAIPSGQERAAVSEADLRALQASEAYQNEHHPQHEATAVRVREGWQRLYPG